MAEMTRRERIMAASRKQRAECAGSVSNNEAERLKKEQHEVLLDIARLTENEPVLGPRLMAVARKPAP